MRVGDSLTGLVVAAATGAAAAGLLPGRGEWNAFGLGLPVVVAAAAAVRHAGIALRAAKAAGSGVALHDPRRDAPRPRPLRLAAELREAIGTEALTVSFQPKVELVAGTVVGVEALLRWHHPVHGHVAPDEFIRVAERSDLIRRLTRFVLRTALAQREAWRLAGRELDMAVNLSVRDLLDSDLPDDVADLLGRYNVPAGALTLEVTEGGIVADHTPAVAVLSRLRDLGVQVSIDDFGTGYSSLSYLKLLPADELKVDRSFVTTMAADPGDARIVRSIIDLAHSFGLRVVAEGVEEEVTWHQLRALGCDVVQGYLLTAPLAAPGLWRWLAEWDEREASRTGAESAAVLA
ncbi:MAG TPA: EAL domain-containing protein [Egibacteraceae bacterium]|nr:EAL domain-containing protein [Egibacteraceae bacterium]